MSGVGCGWLMAGKSMVWARKAGLVCTNSRASPCLTHNHLPPPLLPFRTRPQRHLRALRRRLRLGRRQLHLLQVQRHRPQARRRPQGRPPRPRGRRRRRLGPRRPLRPRRRRGQRALRRRRGDRRRGRDADPADQGAGRGDGGRRQPRQGRAQRRCGPSRGGRGRGGARGGGGGGAGGVRGVDRELFLCFRAVPISLWLCLSLSLPRRETTARNTTAQSSNPISQLFPSFFPVSTIVFLRNPTLLLPPQITNPTGPLPPFFAPS